MLKLNFFQFICYKYVNIFGKTKIICKHICTTNNNTHPSLKSPSNKSLQYFPGGAAVKVSLSKQETWI